MTAAFPTSIAKCQVCGKEKKIRGSRKKGFFCSTECRLSTRLKPCLNCGVEFVSESSRPNHCCSQVCRDELRSKNASRIECRWCGKEFRNRGKEKYECCSNECRYAKARLKASIRGVQAIWRSKLKSNAWLEAIRVSYTRAKTKAVTEDGIKERLRSAIQINKHREPRERKENESKVESCEEAFLNSMNRSKIQSSEDWKRTWAQNTASNMRKRARRKAALK